MANCISKPQIDSCLTNPILAAEQILIRFKLIASACRDMIDKGFVHLLKRGFHAGHIFGFFFAKWIQRRF